MGPAAHPIQLSASSLHMAPAHIRAQFVTSLKSCALSDPMRPEKGLRKVVNGRKKPLLDGRGESERAKADLSECCGQL